MQESVLPDPSKVLGQQSFDVEISIQSINSHLINNKSIDTTGFEQQYHKLIFSFSAVVKSVLLPASAKKPFALLTTPLALNLRPSRPIVRPPAATLEIRLQHTSFCRTTPEYPTPHRILECPTANHAAQPLICYHDLRHCTWIVKQFFLPVCCDLCCTVHCATALVVFWVDLALLVA